MKIVCLYAPRLPVQIERERYALDAGTPLIVGGRPWNPDVVLACCAKAQEAGVSPGMPLARAVMRCPDAQIIHADHEAYQTAHDLLLSAQRQYTDQIETAGLGFTFASAEGLRRLFDDETALAKTWLNAAREVTHLDVQAGMAYHRYTAEQAALAAPVNTALVVPSTQERAFLSALPLSALPALEDDIRRLHLLGVNTLGALSAMPRTALIRQFNADMGAFHDMASGNDARGIFPDAPPLELKRRYVFEPPVTDQPRMLARAEDICASLSKRLLQHQYQAQGMRIELITEYGGSRTTASSLEPPTADRLRLFKRLSFLVSQAQPSHAVMELIVTLYPLRPRYLAATQLALFSAPLDHRLERLGEAIRRLRSRFGEFIIMIASLWGAPPPERIHITPDKTGIPRSLVVRDNIHLILHIYEHWREHRLWWAQPIQRDYYRVEDDAGRVRVIYLDVLAAQWWLERQG